MKKLLFVLLLILCCFMLPVEADRGAFPVLSAQAAILIDARSGFPLYEKNADLELPMASTTKILTALITLENAEVFDEAVLITPQMAAVEGSSMGLRAGWQVRLSSLAAGMLLASGNDAANAAAIALGGTLENFAALMNARAEELGLSHTHFETPSGLDGPEHHSSARDLALLAREAMKNERFAELTSSREAKVEILSPKMTLTFGNHNKLLRLCEGCIGVKTGYTKRAGRCLVSCVEREGVCLIAVTLNDPDDWNDHLSLYEAGYSKLLRRNSPEVSLQIPVIGGEREAVAAFCDPIEVPLFEGEALETQICCPALLYAPIEQGEIVGYAVFTLGGEIVAQAPLTAIERCAASSKEVKLSLWEKIKKFFWT